MVKIKGSEKCGAGQGRAGGYAKWAFSKKLRLSVIFVRPSEPLKKLNCKVKIEKCSLPCINAFIFTFAVINFNFSFPQ